MEYVLGQRWISQTETELGLGIIVGLEGRHVTVRFPAAEEDRVYATTNSPLARVTYQVGETLLDLEQQSRKVVDYEEMDGLRYYLTADEAGEQKVVPETQLSGHVQLSAPNQRLFSGHFDKAHEYEMRVETLHHRDRLQRSQVRGLLGTRTNLLAHQIYIAQEVAQRYAPRVLLADEVGLGKTIEAGMIIHHQLQTGLASRVLIIVPEPLLHQWLVEMLRKFSLRFALFDQGRYDALLEAGETNPFESEQLVLCGLDFLCQPEVYDRAISAGWDLTIVDEAHHLTWSEDQASEAYQVVEAVAQASAGLLLLTATPEQLGLDSHFARLRLIDPARFAQLAQFRAEQSHYVELNQVVAQLQAGEPLSEEQQAWLSQRQISLDDAAPAELINQLLDQHGTGRVLFRNTRSAVAGFPQRVLHSYPLQMPPGQTAVDGWLTHDPKVKWVEQFLASHRQDKVLLICAQAQTAVDLEKHLHLDVGIRSAAFYEDLSIVERDRAAAYFADEEGGAQVLICSEIGSEGRNFQFAHHLVLFDLPANPDLLEQRIGRLDRIGQAQDVQIHVPYVVGTHQETLFQWYHHGMNAFCASFSAGAALAAEFSDELDAIANATDDRPARLTDLVERTQQRTQAIREELSQGRDRLLELNSCKPAVAQEVIDEIVATEQADALADYMERVFDIFGVDHEPHSEHSLVLTPTEHMLTPSFPLLGDVGVTITYNRERAQVREEWEFLTWESPMVTGVFDLVLGGDLGNTNLSSISLKSLPAGTVLLECFYVSRISAPKQLQVDRFMPATPIRVLVDPRGRDLAGAITHAQLNGLCQPVNKAARLAVVKEIRGVMENGLQAADKLAQKQAQVLGEQAHARADALVGGELVRLSSLRHVNPNIRAEEIEFLQSQLTQVQAQIDKASLELQAARVIIST